MVVRRIAAAGALALVAVRASGAQQQQSVTRAAAISSALARGPRLAIARADSVAARAQLTLARQYENPALSLGYSKDAPQHHVGLDVPFDLPGLRRARIDVARAGIDVAALRFAFEREAIVYDADTTYTQALAAGARARLSTATARDADSVLTLARIRRDAGDASELDVQLAAVSAGQLANAAATDSTDAVTAILAVQRVMGLGADRVSVALTDSLDAAPAAGAPPAGTSLQIAAAEANVRAAELAIARERRLRFGVPSFSVGFDQHDPGGQGNAILPTIGIALPLPLFNQNRGSVEVAQAARDRAQAELALTRIEVSAEIAEARRAFTVAQARAERSRQLVDGANRVASLSLLAYREGAAALSSVIESQRTAREALTQYIDALAAARNAASRSQLLERTAGGAPPANRNHP
jgi:cobalt-zinc-cadmium efflux system outer membrane protein